MNKPQPDSDAESQPEGQPGPAENAEKTASDESSPNTPDANHARNLTAGEMARFVTTIKNAEQQVGEHVIRALQHGDSVAVLTTVVVGPGGQQHIVSAALDENKMAQVNALLQSAADVREEEALCVGFHCLIKRKKKAADEPS